MKNHCPICESDKIKIIKKLPIYGAEGNYNSTALKCKKCKVLFRDFDYDGHHIKNHFSIASYTDLCKESEWKLEREFFFKYIVKLSSEYFKLGRNIRIIDFGCSYGHLLDEYAALGVNCYGVELDDRLRNRLSGKFAGIYEKFQDLPMGMKFEIITLIDSFYYVEDPLSTLKEIKSGLTTQRNSDSSNYKQSVFD